MIATGRTHQIRVHLAHLKAPVLGDPLYGSLSANQKFAAEHPYLHAACIELQHPISGQELIVSAPVPADMQSVIKKFF